MAGRILSSGRHDMPKSGVDVPPRKLGSKRSWARLAQSKSTSNIIDVASKYEPRDGIGGQTDRDNVRELVDFLRTTAPPSEQSAYGEDGSGIGLAVSRENKRMSMRMGRRMRGDSKRMSRPHALGLSSHPVNPNPVQAPATDPPLPDNVVAGTTAHGHRYKAISIPAEHDPRSPCFPSQYPVFDHSGTSLSQARDGVEEDGDANRSSLDLSRFPSPPSTPGSAPPSRCSSPHTCTSLGLAVRPHMRPRSSSKHSRASPTPPVSLNEIVMRSTKLKAKRSKLADLLQQGPRSTPKPSAAIDAMPAYVVSTDVSQSICSDSASSRRTFSLRHTESNDSIVQDRSEPTAYGNTVRDSDTIPNLLRQHSVSKSCNLARRKIGSQGQSQDFKPQGLEISHLRPPPGGPTMVESPVLGQFSQQTPGLLPSSLERVHGTPMTPSSMITPTADDFPLPAKSTIPTPPLESNQLTFSSVMTQEIKPDSPHEQPKHNFTLSAMRVVADIEPRKPPNLKRFSLLMATENNSSKPKRMSPPAGQKFKVLPLPIRVYKNPPPTSLGSIGENSTTADFTAPMPTPPITPATTTPMASKRMSFPIMSQFDRRSVESRWDWQMAQERQLREQEEKKEEEQRRKVIVKERFEREKLEKEREIVEMLARAELEDFTDRTSREREGAETLYTDSGPQDHENDESEAEIDRRLQRLEKNGDAWLGVMKPLLDNMNRTVRALQVKPTGVGSLPLTKEDFSVDMIAEARPRTSFLPPPTPTEDSEFLNHQNETSASNNDSLQPRDGSRKPRIARSNSRLKVLGQNSEKREREHAKSMSTEGRSKSPRPQTANSRHESDAQMAMRRHINQQVAMMDDLMDRWDSSPGVSQDAHMR